MRIATDHDLTRQAKERGYHVEYVEYFVEDEDTGQRLKRYDERTSIIDFPVTHGDDVILADDMTAIDQLKVVQRLQRDWSDNAVSVTIYYWPHELPAIRDYLREHWATGFKAVSFLLRQNHGFAQAPWTTITKEEYDERMAAITKPFGCDEDLGMATLAVDDDELVQNSECSGGSCPRR